jgi:purine-binding chemotaxis protein CheW
MSDLVRSSESPDRLFCTFRADERLYGIDVAQVREVSTHVAVTAVPQAPPIVRGLTNLRSRIFLVLDLRAALGLPPAECTPESRLVVLNARVVEHLGLLVDRGGEIIRVRPDRIESGPPAAERTAPDATAAPSGDSRSTLVAGVCKLDNELMMIIDPVRLVEATQTALG